MCRVQKEKKKGVKIKKTSKSRKTPQWLLQKT